MAQLMPLPLTVSCFSKIQIGFTFLVPAHPGSPGQRAVKQVCMCACVVIRDTVVAVAEMANELQKWTEFPVNTPQPPQPQHNAVQSYNFTEL